MCKHGNACEYDSTIVACRAKTSLERAQEAEKAEAFRQEKIATFRAGLQSQSADVRQKEASNACRRSGKVFKKALLFLESKGIRLAKGPNGSVRHSLWPGLEAARASQGLVDAVAEAEKDYDAAMGIFEDLIIRQQNKLNFQQVAILRAAFWKACGF